MPKVSVHYAMRYGHPGIAAALEAMIAEGCTRILTAPLYPQYCAATTATANDAVFGALARMRVSRRCERFRLIMTIRSISKRCAATSSASSRPSLSSQISCC